MVLKVFGAPPQNPSHTVDSRSSRMQRGGMTDMDHWMKYQTSADFGKKQDILKMRGMGRSRTCVATLPLT